MASSDDRPVETLGGLLASRRRQHFVGRSAEVDLFRAVVDSGEEMFRVLYVHGPGGIGKSTLLDAYEFIAANAGTSVVRVDGRDVQGTPEGVLEAISNVLEVPAGEAAVVVPHGQRLVLLIDGYEHLNAVDGWVRDRLLPRLPASTVAVFGSRRPAPTEWRGDPAWSELVRIVSLRNLDPDSARTFLLRREVPEARHDEILRVTYGHPLALSLVADVLSTDSRAELGSLPTDLVGALLERLVTRVPSQAHRKALGVLAVARNTNEGLLRGVLGEVADSEGLFDWLASMTVTEVRSDGVVPHELIRDLLDADLRWRDPDGYRDVFRAIRAYTMERVRNSDGREQQRAIADLKFLFRNLRSALSPVAWEVWGDYYPDRAVQEDREVIVDLVGVAEGRESALLASHWFDLQPEGFYVIRRREGEVRGVVALLEIATATAESRNADPGTATAWRHVESTAPVRPGEVVTQCRFIVDAETYQGPSPTINAVPIITLQRQLTNRHLAWDFLNLADPDQWDEYFAAADLPRAVGADFFVGGHRYGLFAHDFRKVPVETMTERWTERALADDALLLPTATLEPEFLVLAHADFDAAVKQALRDLHRSDLLTRNPLLRTRLVASQGAHDGVETLEEVLRAAVGSLAEDPRDDRLYRAIDCTYLGRSRTQEAAAAVLDLPFSTYRRHLRLGQDRVVAWLWQKELGGG